MHPDPQVLHEAVEKLRDAVAPVKIILFGSGATGEMDEHSDLDLLVVVKDQCNRIDVGMDAYAALRDLQYAKDIIVVREEDVSLYGNNPYLVIHKALTEGRELYSEAA
jgi:uncharacterized protein